jgi:polysaccharide chain length determinant protein (PEP-CTERM system associated)
MDQLIRQALSILKGMWQWRWIGLFVAWVVGIIAAIVVVRMPDQFEASARIYVDTQSVLKPLMSGLAVQPNVDQQIAILSRTLISRPNVEKLARMADLDHGVKSKEDQDRLVDGLMRTLAIGRAGGDNLYTLAYRSTQPERAMRVVQSLTSIFVESSLGNKRKDTDSAKQFIEDQIKVYEKKLADAENRLKDFKLRNMNVSGEGRDAFSRMGELNSALNQARLELREAENSRDALKRQITGEEPVFLTEANEPVSNISVPEIDGRIDAMKRSLDGMLQKYTEQHPDIVGARRVIKELEEQKRQEIAARKRIGGSGGSAGPMPVNTNPVYQQLKVSLAEAEANIASLKARVAEYESRYNQFKGSIRMMPELETEFSQLNRDYDVHRANYQALVARRESAVMSGQMDASSATAEFRLIDPPRVTPQPVAPNRPMLFTMAFLGALAAGVFASFAVSQIRPSFLDAQALRDITGIPVLGTVSLIVSEPMKRRERRGLVGFIAGTVALIGSYGAGIFLLFLLSARAG